MLQKTTRIMSENLARTMDRRKFLKRAGETAFAGLAAFAAGRALPVIASGPGGSATRPAPLQPACAPPGPYCNLNGVNEPNGCHGASCFEHLVGGQIYQCHIQYGYTTGCWTTPVTGGYWVCCDCECGRPVVATCGCAQFSGSPVPRPDGPGIKV